MDWQQIRTIAFVGASANKEKDSYRVMMYFHEKGFEVVPINPNYDEIMGIRCYPSLLSVPDGVAKRIDMVDIFRRSDAVIPIINDAVELKRRHNNLKVIWMQAGVINDTAISIAAKNGIEAYQNSCAMLAHKLYYAQMHKRQ
ncbi:MAG: CoA-binding protein [Candidatus Micrarchaeota archaeon]|nr:CoA-binding protein [Candidatus Micrarchaeota archaeon]